MNSLCNNKNHVKINKKKRKPLPAIHIKIKLAISLKRAYSTYSVPFCNLDCFISLSRLFQKLTLSLTLFLYNDEQK